MAVEYQMRRFSLDQEKWIFRVIHHNTMAASHLAQRIEQASALTETDVLGVLDALAEEIGQALLDGNRVQIAGVGTFSLTARGTTEHYDDYLKPEQLEIAFRPDAQLRRHIHQHAEGEKQTAHLRAPRPHTFTDAATERRDVYTAGSIGLLYGSVLKFDADDPAQGVFFVDEDGHEVRATVYAHVTKKRVHFLIPPGLTGAQRLIVRAQPRFGPEVRQGELQEALVPA
jgi:predicted histone-like DNA-binding protein